MWFGCLILHPRSSTASLPLIPKHKRKGSSSNLPFSRGKLLNFGGCTRFRGVLEISHVCLSHVLVEVVGFVYVAKDFHRENKHCVLLYTYKITFLNSMAKV